MCYTGDFLLPSTAIITKNVETRTSKKGVVSFYRYLFHLSLQIGLGLAGFTIIPWLLIVIGFGWLTVVSVYACMYTAIND